MDKVTSIYLGGVNADSVVLSDADGTYGIKRVDDDYVVAVAGADVICIDTATYEFDVSSLPTNYNYIASFKYTLNDVVSYQTVTFGVDAVTKTTVSSLFAKVRALLNIYTEEGVQIPEADYVDMQTKAIVLADMAHKELFEIAKIDKLKAIPTTITAITDTTEVNYKADQAIVYYIAARLAPFKKKELVQYFEDKYEQLKKECANATTVADIIDCY